MSKESAMGVAQAAAVTPTPAPTQAASQVSITTPQSGLPATQTPPDVNAQRLALFAKKEAQLQTEREKIKADWEQRKQVVARAEEYNKRWEQFEKTKATNKLEALKMAGFTVEDLVALAADENGKVKSPDQIAQEVAETVEKKVDEKLNARDQQATKANNDKLIANFKTNIKSSLEKSGDKYPAAVVYGNQAEKLAYDIVVENLKTSPNEPLLPISEALEIANNHFQKKLDAAGYKKSGDVPRGTNTTINPVNSATQQNQEPARHTSGRNRTLTNSVSATSQALNPGRETADQKKQRLVQKLQALATS